MELPLPRYFTAASVNSYIVTDTPVTLIDTGAFFNTSVETLKKELSRFNIKISDIKRILLTHGHVDHCGVAGYLHDNFGTEVHIHSFDKSKVIFTDKEKLAIREKTFISLIDSLDFSTNLQKDLETFFSEFFHYGTVVKKISFFKHGDKIKFENFLLKVIHLPGHTAGSCGFITPDNNFITGDAILKNFFVTPVLEFKENGVLHDNFKNYIKTLQNLKNFTHYNILPGHGNGNFDIKKRADNLLEHIENLISAFKEKYNPSLSVKENFENMYQNVNSKNFYFFFSLFYGIFNYLGYEKDVSLQI